ncbi:hypothetical protein KFE25_004081 [Diacronema lutheri]|uniref:PIN domain-containing protein n=2 Tax=Diacronema lutheri TaxID=2081491 RepID=A0A8J6CDR3_DIALT|nr:hypothetical protein KFE25_004081 [Diacronema lutheri]
MKSWNPRIHMFAPPACYASNGASGGASDADGASTAALAMGAARTRGRGGGRGAARGTLPTAAPYGARVPGSGAARGVGAGTSGARGRGGAAQQHMFAPPAIYSAPPSAFFRGGARALGRGGRGAVARPDSAPPSHAPPDGAAASSAPPTSGEPSGSVVRAEDLDDEPLEISRADLGLPPLLCGRFATAQLVEVRGPTTLRLAAERRGLADADVRDVLLELRRVSAALYAAAVRARGAAGLKAGVRVSVDVCLEDNFGSLTDEGVRTLVAGLLAMRDVLQPRILRLHANRIGDDGAESLARLLRASCWPIEELHLSHNRIGERGFRALLDAALAPTHTGAARWPRADLRAAARPSGAAADVPWPPRVPLWLRVEFNLLQTPVRAMVRGLDARQRAALCFVQPRGPAPAQCDIKHCKRCSPAAVHVPYLECQKLRGARLLDGRLRAAGAGPIDADVPSPRAATAAERPSTLPGARDGGVQSPRASPPVVGAECRALSSPADGRAQGGGEAGGEGEGEGEGGGEGEGETLFVLLDTNALISLAMPPAPPHPACAAAAAAGAWRPALCFESMLCGKGCVTGSVRMLLVETVRQQLEAIKQQGAHSPAPGARASPNGRPARDAAGAARTFFSRQLVELSARGQLLYLDTLDVEDVARAQLCRVESPEGRADGRRDMDGRIVDCGLVLSRQLREGDTLLLLTDDRELLARARNHGLAAESLRDLARALGADGAPAPPWGAAQMRAACSEPCRRLLDLSHSARPSVLGAFDELHHAHRLGARAAAMLRALARGAPEAAAAARAPHAGGGGGGGDGGGGGEGGSGELAAVGGGAQREVGARADAQPADGTRGAPAQSCVGLAGSPVGTDAPIARAPDGAASAPSGAEAASLASELEAAATRWHALVQSRDAFQRQPR